MRLLTVVSLKIQYFWSVNWFFLITAVQTKISRSVFFRMLLQILIFC